MLQLAGGPNDDRPRVEANRISVKCLVHADFYEESPNELPALLCSQRFNVQLPSRFLDIRCGGRTPISEVVCLSEYLASIACIEFNLQQSSIPAATQCCAPHSAYTPCRDLNI